jgi:anti-anti-sigma factor
MPTQITQLQDEGLNSTTLKVEGELLSDDAQLIKKLANELLETPDLNVFIDLADVSYLDSEAAHILNNLAAVNRVTLTGIEIFLQTVVNEVERRSD